MVAEQNKNEKWNGHFARTIDELEKYSKGQINPGRQKRDLSRQARVVIDNKTRFEVESTI